MSRRKPPLAKPASAPPSISSSPIPTPTGTMELLQKGATGGMDTEKSVAQMFHQMVQMNLEVVKGQREIKEEIAKMRNDFSTLRKDVDTNRQGIVGVEGRSAELEKEMREVRGGMGGMENFMAKAEFERMSLFLRFQNVPEVEEQDLKDVMCTMIAEYLGKEKREIQWDMDLVYRVNSAYARMHDVPREVHVKFVRRATRDEILRAQRGGALKYRDKEITILKQVPKKIREIRRKYSSLTKKLFDNGIWFKWVFPEGMVVFWKGDRIKINSPEEAQAFLKEHFSDPESKKVEVGGDGVAGGAGGEMPGTSTQSREEDTIAGRLRSQK